MSTSRNIGLVQKPPILLLYATTRGNWEGKLPDPEVVGVIGVGMICWHLEGIASISVEDFGAGISLEVALASAGPAISVMPMIGTEGGEGDMDEAADG